MNKTIALLFGIFALALIAPICACKSEKTAQKKAEIGYQKTENNDGTQSYSVFAVEKLAGVTEVEIPAEHEGLPVIGIMSEAFKEFHGLQRVTLPEGLTYISENAFFGCDDLIEVDLPGTLTSIGDEAFRDCKSLKNISLPDGILSIGTDVFRSSGVYENEEYWQDGALYVDHYLFASHDMLTGNFTVKNGTKAVANLAFHQCAGLTSVTIPQGVRYIGDFAFNSCTALQKVVVHGDVTYLGNQVFSDCPKLSEVVFGEGISEIGGGVFVNTAYALDPEHYDGDILYVGNYAVGIRTESVLYVVRDGTELLCAELFSPYNMMGTCNVVLPASVKVIGLRAFGYDASAIAPKIFYQGTSADWEAVTVLYPEFTIKNRTVYYYSETQPEESGHFWHFVEGVPKVW